MNAILTILMAAFFLWVGIVFIQRPRRVVEWILAYFARATGNPQLFAGAAHNRMLVFMVRLFGVLALINFILQLYILTAPLPA